MDEISDCTHLALCFFMEPKLRIQWVKSKSKFMKEMYIKDYFNTNKDKEHMEFEGKYDLEELLDPDGPAPWGETEDV